MKRTESSVILTNFNTIDHVYNCCRLIQTVDLLHGDDVFSIFLTTKSADDIDEEFVYDIARDEFHAKAFFSQICKEHVTACTLLDITRDFLAE